MRLRSAFFAFRASAEILRLLSKREILSYAMYGRAKAKIPLLTHEIRPRKRRFVASVSADSTLTLSSAVKLGPGQKPAKCG